ncbi:MAG: head-tail connector protein [Vallitalea sp.]|nr:head-tail connector protein [Vallitalea sp.]
MIALIVSLEEVKRHLRIETDEDDNSIRTMITAAESFIESATDSEIKEDDKRAKIICLFLITDMYENRGFVSEKGNSKIREIVKMMLLQL